MLKKIMPIVLLLVGTGAGVGAGIYMRPAPAEMAEGSDAQGEAGGHAAEDKAHKDGDDHDAKSKDDHSKKTSKSDDGHGDDHGDDAGVMEYVKLNNQFVVPIVKDKNVASLVVLSLSLEVPAGSEDDVYKREPKVRDSILQVLFDHANIGGFDGAFTEAKMLNVLRRALREVAQRDLGADVVNDVLILEIARQDY